MWEYEMDGQKYCWHGSIVGVDVDLESVASWQSALASLYCGKEWPIVRVRV